MYIIIPIISVLVLFSPFIALIISLLTGTFILYNQIKSNNKIIKIEGNIKINLFFHIFYLISIILCPIILINKINLIGLILYYCIIILLIIIIFVLVKRQMKNVEEIICFLNIPAIIKLKQNKITRFLRPFSNKIVNIIFISLLLIIVVINIIIINIK
jgi:hypothetical protein